MSSQTSQPADMKVSKDDVNELLLDAALVGNAEVVSKLLAKGADANCKGENGTTPLHNAAIGAFEAFFQDTKESDRLKSANYAAEYKYADVAEILIKHDALITALNSNGSAPLHNAMGGGYDRKGRELCDKSSRCFTTDPYPQFVRRLLELGADKNIRDESGNTPLHYATVCHTNAWPSIDFLLGARAEVDAQNDAGSTPLHCAVEAGHKTMVRKLLAGGANAGVQDGKGYTPLIIAIRKIDIMSVIHFVKREVKLAPSSSEETPLQFAYESYCRHPNHDSKKILGMIYQATVYKDYGNGKEANSEPLADLDSMADGDVEVLEKLLAMGWQSRDTGAIPSKLVEARLGTSQI